MGRQAGRAVWWSMEQTSAPKTWTMTTACASAPWCWPEVGDKKPIMDNNVSYNKKKTFCAWLKSNCSHHTGIASFNPYLWSQKSCAFRENVVEYSDTSQSWASVRFCIRWYADCAFLFACYVKLRLKRCCELTSHASKEACDKLLPSWLVAVTW